MWISPQSWNWLFLTKISQQQQQLMSTLAMVYRVQALCLTTSRDLHPTTRDRETESSTFSPVFMAITATITAFCSDLHVTFAIRQEILKKRFSFFSFFPFVAQCPANGKTLGRPSCFPLFNKHRLTFTGLNRGGKWRLYEGKKWRKDGSRKVTRISSSLQKVMFTVGYLGNAKKNHSPEMISRW